MRRIVNFKNMFVFLLGGIIFSGVTAYASYRIHAGEVSYTPENESFKVDNVNLALDNLYEKVNDTPIKLLSAVNGEYPQNPMIYKYSDSSTYTVPESGDLLLILNVNHSAYLININPSLTSTNPKTEIKQLGMNTNWTVTVDSGSRSINYVYKLSEVNKGDQLNITASGTISPSAIGHNNTIISYQVYKIG